MAGFVKFNPDEWSPPENPEPAAKVAKVAKDGPALATLAGLAGVLAAGVKSLDGGRPPDGTPGAAWALSCRDAISLVNDGWLEKALALSWSSLDLFGVPTDGDPYGAGLAPWLAGRKLLALTEGWAAACDVRGNRFFFNRPRSPNSALMWTLGRGR